MERRSFLKMTGAVVGACALDLGGVFGAASTGDVIKHPSGLPRRVLGRTGLEVSVVAFPGLCMVHDDQAACTRAARMAIDKGVNWFDVAPAYGNGTCEERMGVALEGVRDSVLCRARRRARQGRARLELSGRSSGSRRTISISTRCTTCAAAEAGRPLAGGVSRPS